MEVVIKFKVYTLNNVMGSSEHKALEEVVFKGFKSNYFDTEEEAIQAIVDDKKTYADYIILKNVFVRQD